MKEDSADIKKGSSIEEKIYMKIYITIKHCKSLNSILRHFSTEFLIGDTFNEKEGKS